MKIHCLVDNSVAPLSDYWGEHGLAFLVETDEGRRLLFDTGAGGTVLMHNLERAGVGVDTIDAVVLSHSHPDHTGGLPALLKRREGIRVSVYAHPELLRPRYSQKDGDMKRKWLPMSADSLKQQAELRLSDSRKKSCLGSGPPVRSAIEPSPKEEAPTTSCATEMNGSRIPIGTTCHWFSQPANGPFVLCGCCHAGLLNTLAQVRSQFGTNPVGVAGGTHLVGAGPDRLADTVEKLRDLGSPALHLNHCTGTPALVALSRAFGDRVSHLPAGTTLEIESCV